MSSDFWAKAIGGIAQPRQQPAPPPQQQGGAWWQPEPQQQPQYPPQGYPQQQYRDPYGQPPQQYPQGYDPALQAQMPYGGPTGPQGVPQEQHIKQLMRIPSDQLNQQQMEMIAQWELENKPKYASTCPACGSANFAPAGMVVGGSKLGADKCFECGASTSTFTSSPEPARGGGGNSKVPYRDVRQIDTGGAGGSMYLKFHGMPGNYIPRGA